MSRISFPDKKLNTRAILMLYMFIKGTYYNVYFFMACLYVLILQNKTYKVLEKREHTKMW